MTGHGHFLAVQSNEGESLVDDFHSAFLSAVGREDLAPETVHDLIADAVERLGMTGVEPGWVVRGDVEPDVVAAVVSAIAFPAPFSPMAMPDQPVGRMHKPAARRSWLSWRRAKAA